jgi:hypothetical protein
MLIGIVGFRNKLRRTSGRQISVEAATFPSISSCVDRAGAAVGCTPIDRWPAENRTKMLGFAPPKAELPDVARSLLVF